MRYLLLLLASSSTVWADTIEHYMNIANNIPQMEMKADAQAHEWARSARNVLTLTNQTIAETLQLANESAKQHGRPLFCLPAQTTLDANLLNDLIQQTYRETTTPDKNKMTVSEIALLGINKKYPCQGRSGAITPASSTPPTAMQSTATTMAHVSG